MIAPICFSTFIRYHISADHRSLPVAHHEEVCDIILFEQRREPLLPIFMDDALRPYSAYKQRKYLLLFSAVLYLYH